jgi:hypothetical protein
LVNLDGQQIDAEARLTIRGLPVPNQQYREKYLAFLRAKE